MDVKTDRINAYDAAPEAMTVMYAVENYIDNSGLEKSLIELVKMRASQINGCAFCLDMHGRDARKNGDTEQRLFLLDAWRESSLFSPRERAALAWTEALTSISSTHAPDAVFEDFADHFTNEEATNLTLVICQINSWNRIAIGFRYQHS
ncbi:MAG: carboxymuconolactone decarboxylase family protein [Methyloligellaceae bacterium]